MKEDIIGVEETLQDELIKHGVPAPSGDLKPEVEGDDLPESMREKVETVEISTLTPNK